MLLKLKNAGMIKEADVKIDGLTVIAGENDTGKSTVGKALFSTVRNHLTDIEEKDDKAKLILNDTTLNFPIFIETPDLLSKFNYIKNTYIILKQYHLNFSLPNEVIDLILRISQEKTGSKNKKRFQSIKKIIKGEVYYDSAKDDIFYKKEGLSKALEMAKTSNGIKMFGFFQMLILNESIKKGTVLILDEPEVHLHPKWQLKMAEMIVQFAKEGIYILVTSHSPYMIEALKRYSETEKIENKTNFYLAKEGYIKQTENSNSLTLSKIFEILSEPFNEFDKMDTQKIENE